MKNSLSLMDIMRLKMLRGAARVQRCHTIPVLYRQTVGEHTFGVLALLALIDPEARQEVWMAALLHDAAESETGDVPAPAKWGSPALADALAVAEKAVLERLGLEVPLLTKAEEQLVKFCDTMELVFYCIEERRMGNAHYAEPVAWAALRAVDKTIFATYPRTGEIYEYARAQLDI